MRLIVVVDMRLPIEDQRIPLGAFLLVNAGDKRTAREACAVSIPPYREGPVMLTLRPEADRQVATVVAKSETDRVSKTYAVDPRTGESNPQLK